MAEIVEQAQEREACEVCVESVLEVYIYHRFNSHHIPPHHFIASSTQLVILYHSNVWGRYDFLKVLNKLISLLTKVAFI